MTQTKTPQDDSGEEGAAGGDVDYNVLDKLVRALRPIAPSHQERYIQAALHLIGVTTASTAGAAPVRVGQLEQKRSEERTPYSFSEDRSPTGKEFLLSKKPKNEAERVTCLAYYLAHYKKQEMLATSDITQANNDAAQTKLSNPSSVTDRAVQFGFLVRPTKGTFKLSAAGEIFVQHLPDRERAYREVDEFLPRRSKRSE